MKKYLLFDLDGTLTDPKVGITTCVQYALQSFGIEEPDLDKLEPFIGPPLKESFMNFYQMDEKQAEEAVAKYRERFQDIGIFENELYKGIPEMLHTLQSKGMFLAVASSKPTVFVERILEHFNIAKYFTVVVGSELDGTRVNKDEVVQEALKRLFKDKPMQKEQVYMIGDRKFDVEGAKALEVESVGVTYGYGSMEELKEAKADYIVRSVEELQKFLLRGTDESEKKKGLTFSRIWVMLYSFLMFMLIRSVVVQGLSFALSSIAASLPEGIANFLVWRDETGAIAGYTGNASTIITAISYLAGIIPIASNAKTLITKTSEDMRLTHLKGEPVLNYVWMAVLTVFSVVGLNLLFELSGFTQNSEAYKIFVEDSGSATFALGLLCYGLVTPIAEELLFRGIIYNYLKRFIPVKLAIILGAFLFGSYHMNMVQGAYGFIMGALMIYGYEYFGSFMVPLAIHIVNNVLAYCLSYTSIVVTGFVSWPVCVVSLAVAVLAFWLLKKQKKIL